MNKTKWYLLILTFGLNACAPQRRSAEGDVKAVSMPKKEKRFYFLGKNIKNENFNAPGVTFSENGDSMSTTFTPIKMTGGSGTNLNSSDCNVLQKNLNPSFILAAKDSSWKNIRVSSTTKGSNLGFAIRIAKVDRNAKSYPTYEEDSCALRFYVEYPKGSFLADDVIPVDTESGDEYHFWVGVRTVAADFTLEVKPN